VATYKCEICQADTGIFSRYRGAYCGKHWETAQSVDAGEKMNNRIADGISQDEFDRAAADLKARIRLACIEKDKAQAQ